MPDVKPDPRPPLTDLGPLDHASAPQSHYAFNLSLNFRLTMDAAQAIQITAGDPDFQNDTARDKDRVTCRLCRRQFAKYTCPTCNIPYCSLTCFRSQAHNQCSEGFYKKEIEGDIHAGPSKSAEERRGMMDLLRKFEEEQSQEMERGRGLGLGLDPTGEIGDAETDDEDEEPSDLARRFAAVDIKSASHDEIWAKLTPDERKKFMKAFEDPTSELAQQLLASELLEKEIQEPWWEGTDAEVDADVHVDGEGDRRSHNSRSHRYGARPKMMEIPSSMTKPIPAGHPLVYNMCAICIAYAYVTRHLGTSPLASLKSDAPEYSDGRQMIARFLPFLTERKSTKLYPNLSSVITEVWALFELGKMTSELFSLLLEDASTLLKPLRVVEVASEVSDKGELMSQSHPHLMPILVLSDILPLFPAKGHTAHKLLFYAAHLVSTPTVILDTLAGEMMARAGRYRSQQG